MDKYRDSIVRSFSEIGSMATGWARGVPRVAPYPAASRRRRPARHRGRSLLFVAAIFALIAALVVLEARTAVFESMALSRVARNMTYWVDHGPGEAVNFSQSGPFDLRRGYSRIGNWTKRLQARGYRVVEQARLSRAMIAAARFGITPPYDESAVAGLVVKGADGTPIFDARQDVHHFESYDQVPPLLVRVLVFLENRELEDRNLPPTANPAVEWDRLAHAALLLVAERAGLPVRREGGSTLAVQIEKYRHSENGRTESVSDKFRQMLSASLRAYHQGPDTREERRRIVLDYLNTVPLAAAPRYGEVHGIGEGLRVWFGLDPDAVYADLRDDAPVERRARALKPILALLYSVRGPSRYLYADRQALEDRAATFADVLARHGVVEPELAERLKAEPLRFTSRIPVRDRGSFIERKAVDAIRRDVSGLLEMPSLYELDRLHLEVQTTLDDTLQRRTQELFAQLADSGFVRAQGLVGKYLLGDGDPRHVVYSLHLVQSAPEGQRILVHADNLNQPFDVNDMMRMELGSTAKLRTLVHYLELVAKLHDELAGRPEEEIAERARKAGDPLTLWAADNLTKTPELSLDTLLARALDRTYSASPYEAFFTGSGLHSFSNFDPDDNGRRPTVREALVRSTNLSFVRLMRDLVRYHEARLPYDVQDVLKNPASDLRRRMIREEADRESRIILSRAYRRLRGVEPDSIPARLLGRPPTAGTLSVLHFAWGGRPETLPAWLAANGLELEPGQIERLARGYGNPRFGILDHAYLLRVPALELWCASELRRNPGASWEELVARSEPARDAAAHWLMRPGHFGAQNTRLRARVERDAFERMTPAWRRVGFPFRRLVPSLATSIGSSADRPEALAELMGILVNDGVRRPERTIDQLRFATGTPYHTVLAAPAQKGERVLPAAVARAARRALADVVQHGTARRLAGAFFDRDSTELVVGAKTGSGDNRLDTYARGGRLISSKATNRTASVVFYIGDRHYGVITASVTGARAGRYSFTSSLPLAVLQLMAPELSRHIAGGPPSRRQPAQVDRQVAMRPAARPQPASLTPGVVAPGALLNR